jgi:hypothetical protein
MGALPFFSCAGRYVRDDRVTLTRRPRHACGDGAAATHVTLKVSLATPIRDLLVGDDAALRHFLQMLVAAQPGGSRSRHGAACFDCYRFKAILGAALRSAALLKQVTFCCKLL